MAKLKSVQIFHRHGDRTPQHSFAKDSGRYECAENEISRVKISIPHSTSKMWMGNCNFGMLTKEGQSQARKLGEELARIYNKAFSKAGSLVPTMKNIYLRSTDVPRTIETLQWVIEGFFPNNSHHIPIHVRPALVDSLSMRLDLNDNSNKLSNIYNAARSRSKEYQAFLEASKELKWKLDRITNSDLDVNQYFDQFRCRECHGQSSICGNKECVTQETKNEIYRMAEWWSRFEFDLSRKEEYKLRMSDILGEIIDNANHDEYLMRFYSVHDTNLMPLLSLFATDDQYWPPYISSLIIETWTRDDETLLRMIYNGQILYTKVCNGAEFCTLKTLHHHLINLKLLGVMAI